MAFALAHRNTATDNRQIMATTTSTIVLITVLFNGGLASWIIEKLSIKLFFGLDIFYLNKNDVSLGIIEDIRPIATKIMAL